MLLYIIHHVHMVVLFYVIDIVHPFSVYACVCFSKTVTISCEDIRSFWSFPAVAEALGNQLNPYNTTNLQPNNMQVLMTITTHHPIT